MKKMVNYYPANAAGPQMWTTGWDTAQIAIDFAKIAALGANTVRIFVHPAAIGYPAPDLGPDPADPDMLFRIRTVVGIASIHGLRVHLTLFDLYPQAFGEAAVFYAPSKTWAKAVLAPFVGHPAIACVELHNEIPPGNATVMSWVKVMLPYVRRVGGHPVTVSATSTNAEDTPAKKIARFQSLVTQLRLAKAQPDFYDWHCYDGLSDGGVAVHTTLTGIKKACAGVPLECGETGQSTYGKTDLNVQAHYLTGMGEECEPLGFLPGVWMLNDLTADAIEGGPGDGKEYRFGVLGKPAEAAVAAMFGAANG